MGYEVSTQPWTRAYIAKGVLACIGGMIMHLVIGSLYQWGIINIYVTSYFKILNPSVTLESNAVAFPLMMFCYGLTMRIGIHLAEITHPIIVLSSVTVLFSISVFVSSYMSAIWVFLFFYGILFGLFTGMVFMIPVVECNKYFPGMKMYVNGIVLAGTGWGSVVFSQFSYAILNPHHITPIDGYYIGDAEREAVAFQVPSLIRYLALLYLCMGLLATAMMAPVALHNRRKLNEKLQKERLEKQQKIKNGIPIEEQVEVFIPKEANSLSEAMCTWVFWRQVALVLLVACGLYMMYGNYKTYVKKTINDDQFLTLIGAIASLVNGFSRIIWNIIFLKTGYKTVMLAIISISIAVFATLKYTTYTKGVYMLEIVAVNLCIGGLLVTTPTVVQIIFGQRTGENVYGFFWCVVATGNFIGFLYVNFLSGPISFNNIIYICLGMSCLALPIVLFFKFQGPWKNSTEQLQFCISCRKEPVDSVDQQPLERNNAIQSFQDLSSPTKKQQTTLFSPVKPPKKLQPISHQDFEIILKHSNSGSSIKQEMSNSKMQLVGESSIKNSFRSFGSENKLQEETTL